jgi:hypothetical protein
MLVPWSIIQVVAGQVKPGTWRAPVLWTTLALVAALLLGALLIAIVDRWRKRSPQSERLSPGEQLSQFRKLYEKGELSREEFERIRTLLGGKLRDELHLPPGKPAPTTPAAPAAPTAGQTTGIQALDERLHPPPPGPSQPEAGAGPDGPAQPPPDTPETPPPSTGSL